MSEAEKVFKRITAKGWNLYCQTGNGAEVEKGPVKELLLNTPYTILPRVSNQKDEQAIQSFIKKHKIGPLLEVPAKNEEPGCFTLGREVAVFSGEEIETILVSGEIIFFVGIEPQEKEVKIFALSETYMPYSIFLTALEKLPDISKLE